MTALSAFSNKVTALPIGFGVNQGDLEYGLIENHDHRIYHDVRAPNEGAMIQNSLTSAKPVLEQWLGKPLTLGLPVVSSAVSDNASFANFITNSIELQTMGQGSRDLYWHEYTHTNMYHHFFNWFGPAGSLLHLPWMAAWFIEGLAESMSVSTGSDVQFSIERYQALSGNWPTYDRMHSLYQDPRFFLTGYATSGAFVSWIIRQGKPENFPKLLDDFYHYTMPWWWPWIAVPYNGFTPINTAVENYAGVGGEKAYDKYKESAAAYWKSADNGPFLGATPGPRRSLDSLSGLGTIGNDSNLVMTDEEDALYLYRLIFDEKSGWMTGTEKTQINLPAHVGSFAVVESETLRFAVKKSLDVKTGRPRHAIVKTEKKVLAGSDWITIQDRPGFVYGLYLGSEKLAWFEEEIEETRICWTPLAELTAPATCKIVERMPRSLAVLGQRTKRTARGDIETTELWLRRTEQTLQGDRFEFIIWDLAADSTRTIPYANGGRPIDLAFTGKGIWLLTGEETRRTLRRLDENGACQEVIRIADLPLTLAGLEDGHLVLGLHEGRSRTIMRIDPANLKSRPCYASQGHVSPLIYAMKQPGVPTLAAALTATNPWRETSLDPDAGKKIQDAKPLNVATPPFGGEKMTAEQSISAPWTPRPVFLFPFIGAEDPLGTQYGFVSVPLMDHLQNETVRVSMLYGIESKFPNTDLTLTSTRFWPTLSLSLYRSQTWDGTFRNPNDNLMYSIYLDEKGAKLDSNIRFRFLKQSLSLDLGAKSALLKSYLGPFRVREGRLNEPNASLSHVRRFQKFTLASSMNTRFTLEEFNENFDYNVFGISSTASYSLDLFDSTVSAGVEGSRTRGKKMRELREVYFPLRTFISGSGGGYNQNNFRLIGTGSLFGSKFGDTQLRNKLSWTFPLNDDIDKWIGLAYIERLDFTAFINYGGAWYNRLEPRSDDLIAAHGYNFDLQLENKGIRFNLGLGTGQVFGRDFEVYVTSGFDALF